MSQADPATFGDPFIQKILQNYKHPWMLCLVLQPHPTLQDMDIEKSIFGVLKFYLHSNKVPKIL